MIINLIFGFLLVTAGRNFFWLCVGVVGFLIGVQSAVLLGFSNSGVAILVAIALGLLGALLAISFEWLAVVIGVGFLGGGYLFMGLFFFHSSTGRVHMVDFCGRRDHRYMFDDHRF